MHIQKYVYRKMHLHEKKLISSHSPPEGRQSICKSAVLCVPCASTSKMFSGQKDIANVYFDVSKKVIINDLLIVNLELYSSLMLHNVLAVLLLFFFRNCLHFSRMKAGSGITWSNHREHLPEKVLESLSLEVFKNHGDVALRDMISGMVGLGLG